MKISELLDDIAGHDLVLPEFQREYVWGKDQAKQLMVSLIKEYPVGGLLFWKTDQPPELKNISSLPERLGSVQVILDGQQRLTTLYMLMRGQIPPYYRDTDINNDPQDLYYSLETTDFQYYQASRMQDNPIWIRVVDAFLGQPINVFELAQRTTEQNREAFELAQLYNDNLTKLRHIEKVTLPVQIVPLHASLEDAIDIFDRVNSQGTKLTDAELAMTHVTGKWAQARRILKDKLDKLKSTHFDFDLTFMARALTGITCQRALFETIHSRQRHELEEGWRKLDAVLDYLVSVLPQRAFIHSTHDPNTSNVLVPLVVYLSLNDGKFPNETALKHAVHWLYVAQTWSRYTSQTDQRLEQDVLLVVRERSPWQALCDQIIDQRGRLQIKPDDIDGRGVQHPIYNMAFILAKAQGAVDWFSGIPLGAAIGRAYRPQNFYIFPSRLLYANGYDSDNHMHRKAVNEIANRVVLASNQIENDKPPEEYLPEIEERYPGSLVKQFIPMNPELWRLENFSDFLNARRQLIARKINEYLDALIIQPVVERHRSISELIKGGESGVLEFKSTYQWDVLQDRQNTQLRHEVMKTIAAFLNTSGGTLIIGVEDSGNVYGLDRDLNLTGDSADKFLQILASHIAQNIGTTFAPYIKIHIESINDRNICVIDVDKAPEPAFVLHNNNREFWVRLASTSRSLPTAEAVQYINANWE